MGWPEIVQEAERTQMWELRIRKLIGDDAKAQSLIDHAHRKAIYGRGKIADRLAEAYTDAIEHGDYQ